jgi:signal transduction histidine kinase
VLGCKAAAIRLLDRLGSQVEFAASWGLSERYRNDVPEEFARSPLDQQTMRDGVVYVPDVDKDDRIWHPDVVRAEGIRSMLSVALVGRAGPMGVLRAYCAEVDRFTEDDAAYLQAVAAHGVVAVENARAYGRLAELDRDKSKFLRITTHELRSPVRVTEGLLMTLADGYTGPLTAEQLDLVKRAQRRLAALHALVDDLLDLAAGKAEMSRVEREVVDLSAVGVQVVERFRAVATQKGLSLSIDRPAHTLDFWCDRADLDRIVNNLVSNAVKYTRQGGVTVRLARDGRRVRFDITDSGIGIPEDALPHLFNEFFRAANAKAVEESGTGLGLSIVRDLVERHGGRISVASKEGQGTTVEVSFPAAERPA